jgi:hypothetical protein
MKINMGGWLAFVHFPPPAAEILKRLLHLTETRPTTYYRASAFCG